MGITATPLTPLNHHLSHETGGVDEVTPLLHASTHNFAGSDPVNFQYSPSNDIIIANDSVVNVNSLTYCITKEFEIIGPSNFAETLRIQHKLRTSESIRTAKSAIFKNGELYGVENSTTSTSYITYTDDLLFAQGDLIQLYAKQEEGYPYVYIRDFRILGTYIPTELVTIVQN